MTDATHIIVMRHGRSRADDEGVYEGRYDSPLTDIGREQARARALAWQAENLQLDLIIASTLCRAAETAEIVGQILHVPVESDPDWMEMDNGPLAGLAPDVAQARYPLPAFRNPYQPVAGTGESSWELYCRAAKAVEKVIRRGPGQFLVVAHGGVLNAALCGLIGAPPTVTGQGVRFAFGDTGYMRTTYYPDRHQWVIRELRSVQ
jgi:2,3-bisphosphoglycerate-dependent phosphoglycerate mutase